MIPVHRPRLSDDDLQRLRAFYRKSVDRRLDLHDIEAMRVILTRRDPRAANLRPVDVYGYGKRVLRSHDFQELARQGRLRLVVDPAPES